MRMQNGKRVEIDLPEGKDEVVTEFNDALKESVARPARSLWTSSSPARTSPMWR